MATDKNEKAVRWFTQYMNTCVIYGGAGRMHGVDINKASELCRDDPNGAIAALEIFAKMLIDKTQKDKGTKMLAGGLFMSYFLMRHQQSGLPPEEIDHSKLPPELTELKNRHPQLDAVVDYALQKIRVGDDEIKSEIKSWKK